MSKAKKTWIIVAAVLVAAGIIIAGTAVAMEGFDFMKFSSSKCEQKTYTIEENFENISVDDIECSVEILPAEGSAASVVCGESKNYGYTVAAENGTLNIRRTDNRKWYEYIGINMGSSDFDLKIYLPDKEYSALKITTVSGSIEVPDSFTFNKTYLHSTSGKLCFNGKSLESCEAETTSGSIIVKNISGQSLTAKSVSGSIECSNITTQSINANSTSGAIRFTDCVAGNSASIDTVSGQIELNSCDGNLNLSSVSGSIRGSLLSDKHFITDTVSGSVSVPENYAAQQTCQVKTTSGNIRFTIG